MMLMIFVFTVLGMQLFGASLNPSLESYAEEPYARTTRFDTFYWSFVQVSQLVRARDYHTPSSTCFLWRRSWYDEGLLSQSKASVMESGEEGGGAFGGLELGAIGGVSSKPCTLVSRIVCHVRGDFP